jgi:hypothetical protein
LSNDISFFLKDLPIEKLEDILALSDEDRRYYFMHLIKRFYPEIEDKDEKDRLVSNYQGSFELEYILRTEPVIAKVFTCVYTKTGLVREVSNDLYFIPDAYQYQIN